MGFSSKKSLTSILSQIELQNTSGGLKRSLSVWSIMALGVGAIIGAGLFVRTAQAAALGAGPAVTLSFVLASLGCLFAGLCYAEFAAMVPIAGSAYTYSYVALGEFVAWVIGWSLIQEYALGATTVSIAWGEYINNLIGGKIPYEWIHSPFERLVQTTNTAGEIVQASVKYFQVKPTDIVLHHGYLNIPAIFILFLISMLLIKGTSESALFNNIMVIVKISIVLLFVGIGWTYIAPENHTPFLIPQDITPEHHSFFHHGIGGIIFGAGYVFFAFIGFDGVSTAAQESKNPQRDMPIGILGSLALCTVLYILFGYVLTGVANYKDFLTEGKEASVAFVIQTYMKDVLWLRTLISVAIIVGFTTVILAMLYGQSRILYTMAHDGLMPKIFGKVHPKYQTPYMASIIVFIFAAILASTLPIDLAGDLSSFGTLFAFLIVCVGVWVMRRNNPTANRPFKTPLVPLVPILGIIICGGMLFALDTRTQVVSLVWIGVGILMYLVYGRHKSQLK